MSDQPKPASGEWTVYSVMKLRQHHWHEEDKNNAIAIAHNADLAAERLRGDMGWQTVENYKQDIRQLRQQLVAEQGRFDYMNGLYEEVSRKLADAREKVRVLVDALKGINLVVLESNRTQRRTREESLKLLESMCADALKKVK